MKITPPAPVGASGISAFARKQLEKFGWQEGKGLGRNEDGRVEHVKVSKPIDNRGIGATTRAVHESSIWDKVYKASMMRVSAYQENGGVEATGGLGSSSISANLSVQFMRSSVILNGLEQTAGRHDTNDAEGSSDASSEKKRKYRQSCSSATTSASDASSSSSSSSGSDSDDDGSTRASDKDSTNSGDGKPHLPIYLTGFRNGNSIGRMDHDSSDEDEVDTNFGASVRKRTIRPRRRHVDIHAQVAHCTHEDLLEAAKRRMEEKKEEKRRQKERMEKICLDSLEVLDDRTVRKLSQNRSEKNENRNSNGGKLDNKKLDEKRDMRKEKGATEKREKRERKERKEKKEKKERKENKDERERKEKDHKKEKKEKETKEKKGKKGKKEKHEEKTEKQRLDKRSAKKIDDEYEGLNERTIVSNTTDKKRKKAGDADRKASREDQRKKSTSKCKTEKTDKSKPENKKRKSESEKAEKESKRRKKL